MLVDAFVGLLLGGTSGVDKGAALFFELLLDRVGLCGSVDDLPVQWVLLVLNVAVDLNPEPRIPARKQEQT